MSSYAERLSKCYGWPMKIHARGYDAYLVDIQPLLEGQVCPLYRWPGGDGVADDQELKQPAENFHQLQAILKENPNALDDRCDLFKAQPSEWYKELALYAMECIAVARGPEYFTACRHDADGQAAHHVTKAIFEEQDVFDPYGDWQFICAAAALLPWYVKRYTKQRSYSPPQKRMRNLELYSEEVTHGTRKRACNRPL